MKDEIYCEHGYLNELGHKRHAEQFAAEILRSTKNGVTAVVAHHCWKSTFPLPLRSDVHTVRVEPPFRCNEITDETCHDGMGTFRICGSCLHRALAAVGISVDWDSLTEFSPQELFDCENDIPKTPKEKH